MMFAVSRIASVNARQYSLTRDDMTMLRRKDESCFVGMR